MGKLVRPKTGWQRLGPVAVLLAAAAVLAVHAGLTARLLGSDWAELLLADAPFLQGQHALNLYQAELGAEALRSGGGGVVFDPCFQAGWPKSPWFSAEARACECFILLGGKHNAAESVKIGSLAVWLLVPLSGLLAAHLLTGSAAAAGLAAGLALLVCWSEVGLARLLHGDVSLLLASQCLVVWAAALVRLVWEPRLGSWLLATFSLVGLIWLQPLLLVLVLPVGLAFYARAGWSQSMPWQGWFFSSFLVAVAASLSHLEDALRTSWLLADRPPLSTLPPPAVTWDWIGRYLLIDYGQVAFAALLLLAAGAGLWRLRGSPRPGLLRVWLGLMTLALVLMLLAPVWPLVDRFGAGKLVLPVLLLATPPAAAGLLGLAEGMRSLAQRGMLQSMLILLLPLLGLSLALLAAGQSFAGRLAQPPRLTCRLDPEAQALLSALQAGTRPTARLLWEESDDHQVLPFFLAWSGQPMLGGMGPGPFLDCFWLRLADGDLAGKPLSAWTPNDWADLCRRFNIGWVVTAEATTRQTLLRLGGVAKETPMPGGRHLLTLNRPHSYFLKGTGRLEFDRGRVCLQDLQPVEGEVIVSLHYLAGMQATLSRVRLAGVAQKDDPLPLLQLQLAQPVSRVTLFGPE